MNWLIFAILAIVFWGILGVISKLAFDYMDWKQLFILSNIGFLVVSLGFYLYFRPGFSNVSQTGIIFGIVAGIVGAIATLGFYIALSQGKASIIVPLTSLYPVITILLSFLILKEKITILQGVGIALALIAMFLISL